MKKFYVIALVFLVSVVAVNGVQAQEPLAQESINVKLAVSAIQNMQIIDPVKIDGNALSELDKEENMVVEEAGKIRIKSNTPWNLKVHNKSRSNYNVYLNIRNEWKKITARGASFNGKEGDKLLVVDVKVERKSGTETVNINNNESIQLSFTLGH